MVNFSLMGRSCGVDANGWFFHHQGAYLGNEGNEEESVYSRYILTFCRKEAVDSHNLKASKKRGRTKQETRCMDLEEKINQRNAAADARGMAKATVKKTRKPSHKATPLDAAPAELAQADSAF